MAVSVILDLLFRLVMLAPGLAEAYQKIVNSLHQTGEISANEWEARKAEYRDAMDGTAWQTDPL